MSTILQLVGLEKIHCTNSSIRRRTIAFMTTLIIKGSIYQTVFLKGKVKIIYSATLCRYLCIDFDDYDDSSKETIAGIMATLVKGSGSKISIF